MQNQKTNVPQINPFAILAAVIFNLDKSERVKIKADDSAEEIEIDLKIVGAAQEEDAALVCIPIEKVAQFQKTPHDVTMHLENGHLIVMFKKAGFASALLNMDGKKIAPQNDQTMNRLMEKLS